MCSIKRLPRRVKMIILLTCVACVFGLAVPGCSFGGGNTTVSPEAQAKAKENFKKRFDNSGDKRKDHKRSR